MTAKDDTPRRKFTAEELDDFVGGYIDCALFFEPLPTADPSQGEEWEAGDTYEQWDFNRSSLSPALSKAIRSLCAKFLEEAAVLIPGACLDPHVSEYAQAGHDLASESRDFGLGFTDGEWLEPVAGKLSQLSQRFRRIEFEPVGDTIELVGSHGSS